MGLAIVNILIFPGIIFLSIYSFLLEFVDRKLYARFQNRIGPPWYQPLADFIKLMAKETIIPQDADKRVFKSLPVFALASTATAFLYIPIWGLKSLFPFNGDLIVILYFLTIPTLAFALAGWYSSSLYSTIGSVRTLTQLFAYEVPLFIALLGPALFAGSWSISDITVFYNSHPLYCLLNIPDFIVAIIAAQGKLERVPFDIPEAETEIVAGNLTEYSGRHLAIFRMTTDMEMVIIASLFAAVFLPVYISGYPVLGFLVYTLKILFIVFILTSIRALLARLRIEQMVNFCWRYITPIALVQFFIDLFVKGVWLR